MYISKLPSNFRNLVCEYFVGAVLNHTWSKQHTTCYTQCLCMYIQYIPHISYVQCIQYTPPTCYVQYTPPTCYVQHIPPTCYVQYIPPTCYVQYIPPTCYIQYIPPTCYMYSTYHLPAICTVHTTDTHPVYITALLYPMYQSTFLVPHVCVLLCDHSMHTYMHVAYNVHTFTCMSVWHNDSNSCILGTTLCGSVSPMELQS